MTHVVIFVEIGSSVGCKLAQKLMDEKDTHASLVSLEIGRVSLIVSATQYDLWFIGFCFSFFLKLGLEDARWSRGDSGRSARSHKVAIPIRVTSTKFQLIQDAFKLYDLTVVQK